MQTLSPVDTCSSRAPMVLTPRPIPMRAEIRYSLWRGRGGSLDCMWGVQTHGGPLVFLVPFRKDLARMNGAPQPNQKWLPVLGIDPDLSITSLNPFDHSWLHYLLKIHFTSRGVRTTEQSSAIFNIYMVSESNNSWKNSIDRWSSYMLCDEISVLLPF